MGLVAGSKEEVWTSLSDSRMYSLVVVILRDFTCASHSSVNVALSL